MARTKKLTNFEIILLKQQFAEGLKKEQIAINFGISVRTVDRYLKLTKE